MWNANNVEAGENRGKTLEKSQMEKVDAFWKLNPIGNSSVVRPAFNKNIQYHVIHVRLYLLSCIYVINTLQYNSIISVTVRNNEIIVTRLKDRQG